jgi:hypothetical protein
VGSTVASDISGLTSGCDEFSGGASSVASLSIDGDTKAFVSASASLVTITTKAETDVLAACIGICKDLGVTDTWTAMAPSSGNAPDNEVTEACNRASDKIKAVLSAHADIQCALYTSGGHCTVDETKQVACESTCTNATTCQPGDITTLCSPAELTGMCSGSCDANAYCEGTVQTAAQCNGACEAQCEGMCDSAPCHGTHCGGTCSGTCAGDCKVSASAQVNCGANVTCRGGCSVSYTAPQCETTVTPPTCNVSQTCQASCKSTVETTTTCTPPGAFLGCTASATVSVVNVSGDASTSESDAASVVDAGSSDATTLASLDASAVLDSGVTVTVDGSLPADLQACIATVGKNLPPIVLMVQSQGSLALDAASNVVTTGEAVLHDTAGLNGKAVACAGTAAAADTTAAASLNVSVNASASVSTACNGPTKGS